MSEKNSRKSKNGKHTICMVSDFFFPNLGGVEMHIWCLAQCLIHRGHSVIVVTHAYDGRQGIRYMTNGLKVYYLPLGVCYDQVIFPTCYAFFPLFRNILIRERITIVHGHQSTSTITNECILYARTMGFRVCYTDHSLFGFADLASININKILSVTLSDIDHVICVSNTCRENLVLRASTHPSLVSTIPNAVDVTRFTPDPTRRFPVNTINVVLLSRLVYRKGIDLLVRVIPLVCARVTNVHFIIGGDGPKRLLLEEMRERYQLHDRVELLGAVAHHQVHGVLTRGHIFLNCSLTESFCIALLEAASCGLFVVSTKVGGVPEVLPPSMINFAEPNVDSLVDSLIEALSVSRRVVPLDFHERVRGMYSWLDVAKRTETVYNGIANTKRPSLSIRLTRYYSAGAFSGVLACYLVIFLHLLWRGCQFLTPDRSIELCPEISLSNSNVAEGSSPSKTRHKHPRRKQQGHSGRKSHSTTETLLSPVLSTHSFSDTERDTAGDGDRFAEGVTTMDQQLKLPSED